MYFVGLILSDGGASKRCGARSNLPLHLLTGLRAVQGLTMCRYLRSFSGSDRTAARAHGSGGGGCGARCRCCIGCSCHGNYLVVVYIFVKLLYLVNVVTQLFLLDMFLATPFHAYGIEVQLFIHV